MMLLPFDVAERRRATAPGTSLGAIADGLARELAPWLSVGLPIPTGKARLTRIGGRCPAHGSLLEFDPASPWAHRCASCHRLYEAREHHDWWVMGAHLFAAERVVHAAALYLLREDPAHRAVAVRTLRDLAARRMELSSNFEARPSGVLMTSASEPLLIKSTTFGRPSFTLKTFSTLIPAALSCCAVPRVATKSKPRFARSRAIGVTVGLS